MALSDKTQYGVTEQGFIRKRLPEIQEDMFDNLERRLGHSVRRTPDSFIGVLIGVIANEIDKQWQLLEKDYYDRSPVSASDSSLDNTLAYTGVIRQAAERSYLYAVCYGSNLTVLPNNCQIAGGDGEVWNIDVGTKISMSNCVSVTANIPLVHSGTTYGWIIDDKYYTYTANETDSVESCYVKLLNNLPSNWEGKIANGNIVIDKIDRRYGSNVVAMLNVIEVGSPIKFVAVNAGALDPALLSVTSIKTVYSGWNSVANESPAYVGRDAETATEVRQRYTSAVFHNSVGMIESIKAKVEELTDVGKVLIFENRSDVEVDGLLPHSFEVVVQGGDDEEICKAILATGPAGIDTNGEVMMEVKDIQGIGHEVRFSRPTEIPIHIRVELHEYKEETLPGDLIESVKEAIISKAQEEWTLGKDVILERFKGPIYSAISGIGYIYLYGSTDGVTYSLTNIPIGRKEIATIRTENIEVGVIED